MYKRQVPCPKGIDEILIKYKELTVTQLIIFTTPEIITLQIHGTTLTASTEGRTYLDPGGAEETSIGL